MVCELGLGLGFVCRRFCHVTAETDQSYVLRMTCRTSKMAPQNPPPTAPSKPKQSRFLVALFLAKSKPSNLSAQGTSREDLDFLALDSSTEYISSLRSCVREGRRLDGPSSAHSHVNTAEFWRNEFKRSEEAQTELRVRIFELEKMLDARDQSKSATPADNTLQLQKKRRRANEIEKVADGVGRKRLRMTTNESTSGDDRGSLERLVSDMKSASDHDGEIFYHSPTSQY